MKTQSKSLMSMTDAEIRKVFGNPGKCLRIMGLGWEVELLAGEQQGHNMLALAIYQSLQRTGAIPVRKVLEMVIEYYHDNPPALIAMFGETLINNIQNALSNE